MITNGINDNSYTVIHTTTNEPMMPVRLYYKVHNEDLLVRALKKLKCIGFENKKNFVLLYYKEAKNLDLEVYYQDVPEEFYPVILATGCIKQGSILHLDLKSLQRAVCIIDFLGKHIPQTIMEITSFAHSNKFTVIQNRQEIQALLDQNFDHIFLDSKIHNVNHVINLNDEVGTRRLSSSSDQAMVNESLEMFMPYVEEDIANYPEFERISIHYNRQKHDNLIVWLSIRAVIKELVATAHYEGNNNYSSKDALNELFIMLNYDLNPNKN